MTLLDSAKNLSAKSVLPVWKQIRTNGGRVFSEKGLPTRHDEDWKYTSVSLLKETHLRFPTHRTDEQTASEWKTLAGTWLNPQFQQIVFIDGIFAPELSTAKNSAELEILFLDETLSSEKKSAFLGRFRQARRQLGKDLRQDSFEALNSAHAFSGLVIKAKKTASLPLQILFLRSQGQIAIYPKIFVIAESGSQLTLLETYAGVASTVTAEERSLTDTVTEILLEPSSRLEYLRVQSEAFGDVNIGTTRIFMRRSSALKSLSYTTGAELSRHNLDIHCLEPEAMAEVNGLYLLSGKQHADHHTWIDHRVGQCQTTQTYKGILDQSSRSVFNGKVKIHPQAQKASSEQVNHNLLLSQQAEIDSKPELQIEADDVKATHGSTVGQLNEEELFYLLSRAISREQAVEMLSLGFLNDLVEKVDNQKARDYLREHLRHAYLRSRERRGTQS